MVEDSCGEYLSKEDMTFVASFFRHIPESFLPTYTTILIKRTIPVIAEFCVIMAGYTWLLSCFM